MPHRQPVEDLPAGLPLGHEMVHQGDEAGVVGGFQQVDHLVNHDVFEALPGLLREIGVEADSPGARITGGLQGAEDVQQVGIISLLGRRDAKMLESLPWVLIRNEAGAPPLIAEGGIA